MIVIEMSLCIMFFIISYIVSKDIACPIVVSGGIWSVVYLMLILTQKEGLSNIKYISFLIAYISFICGFLSICYKGKVHKTKIKITYAYLEWNTQFKNIIYIVNYILAVYWLLKANKYFGSATSVWTSIRRNMDMLENITSGIMGIMQMMIPIVFFVSWGIYLLNPTKKNRVATLLAIPPMIITMFFSSRGDWFYIIITSVFIFIYIKRPSNSKIILYAITGVFFVLLIFIISSFDKYSNAWVYMDSKDKIQMIMTSYFINPAIAFINWLESDFELAYGGYSFRFIYALIGSFNNNIEVVNTIQPFVETNGISGNVYTALQWYAHDFGLWWAFVIEFILGMIYGKLYGKVNNPLKMTLFSCILLSMLMFPIINQFFDEKITSILSIWIQRIFWLLIFTKTRLCTYERKGRLQMKIFNIHN